MNQAVNSLDGTLLDDYTLTKPAGWAANSTRQTATMTNFVGNFTSTWYESYGELIYLLACLLGTLPICVVVAGPALHKCQQWPSSLASLSAGHRPLQQQHAYIQLYHVFLCI